MHLKDSVSGKPIKVEPDDSGVVSIYACGITPYSPSHVGHARTYVVFDLLKRVLQAQGHNVRLIRNVTDIDDKIINAAQSQGVQWFELSDRFAELNRQLMAQTGVSIPEEPKASGYLNEIFYLIEQLLDLGHAYVAENNDVLYRVSKACCSQVLMPHKEGALRSEQGRTRVDSSSKEDIRDFALWKSMPKDSVGFESPWGWGRPGWHIECSAMIYAMTGGSVTIHGGGVDLKFPHHQCEIMQSEPVTGKPLASIWMHNGSVLSNGRKMSKSEGNYVTWEEALAQAEAKAPGVGGQLLAYTLLQAHWQKPLNWSPTLMDLAYEALLLMTDGLQEVKASEPVELLAALDENLNFPAAVLALRNLRQAGNKSELKGSLEFLGIDTAAWAAKPGKNAVVTDEIASLIAQRAAAREAKNWALSDALRDQLRALGVDVNDATVKS